MRLTRSHLRALIREVIELPPELPPPESPLSNAQRGALESALSYDDWDLEGYHTGNLTDEMLVALNKRGLLPPDALPPPEDTRAIEEVVPIGGAAWESLGEEDLSRQQYYLADLAWGLAYGEVSEEEMPNRDVRRLSVLSPEFANTLSSATLQHDVDEEMEAYDRERGGF